MRRADLVAALCAPLMISGCASLGDAERLAGHAVTEFYADLAAGDPAQACNLLTPAVRSSLEEQSGAPCADALSDIDLPSPGGITTTDVYSGLARVVLERDTVFLVEYEDGWLVQAAGCQPHGELPYTCEIKAG